MWSSYWLLLCKEPAWLSITTVTNQLARLASWVSGLHPHKHPWILCTSHLYSPRSLCLGCPSATFCQSLANRSPLIPSLSHFCLHPCMCAGLSSCKVGWTFLSLKTDDQSESCSHSDSIFNFSYFKCFYLLSWRESKVTGPLPSAHSLGRSRCGKDTPDSAY